MSLSAAVIDALVASGATVEQLAAAMKASLADVEAKAVRKRDADAARQRKSRANRGLSRNVTVTACDERDASSPEVSPNDIYSNPHPTPTSAAEAATAPPLAERVVAAWNEGPGKAGATTAKPLDAGRRKALSSRVREHSEAEVFEAIANLGRSDFHCGGNDRGWRANIGWLLRSAENFQKALELQPVPPPPRSGAAQPFDFTRHILEKRKAA